MAQALDLRGVCGTLLLLLWLSACAAAPRAAESAALNARLDAWHRAAAEADEAAYFGFLTEDAIFLGTDPSERWTRADFEALFLPYFQRETAWTYRPLERHLTWAETRDLAWFDELLDNDKYGKCRGTGVLRRVDGQWRLAHYSLTMLVPNGIAEQVAQMAAKLPVEH